MSDGSMVCATFVHVQKYWLGLNVLRREIQGMLVRLVRVYLNCELITVLVIVSITRCVDARWSFC